MSGEAPKTLREITQKASDIARRTAELEKAIADAYRAGATASTLAKASGYSDAGLLKLLRRQGVDIRPRGRQRALEQAAAKVALRRGRTDEAYVKRAGV